MPSKFILPAGIVLSLLTLSAADLSIAIAPDEHLVVQEFFGGFSSSQHGGTFSALSGDLVEVNLSVSSNDDYRRQVEVQIVGAHSGIAFDMTANSFAHTIQLSFDDVYTITIIKRSPFYTDLTVNGEIIIYHHSIAQTSATVTIDGDGSIDGTNKIRRSGNLYTLTDDISNSTIVLLCNNIILDGAGFTLKGPTGWVDGIAAINLTCSNVTVRNFNIIGFWEAGILGAYNGNSIVNNNITETDRAIAIYADDYLVKGNYLADNHIGIRIVGRNNNMTQNHIFDNAKGFSITNSSNNNIVGNIIENNMIAVNTDYGGFRVYHNNFLNQTIGYGGAWSAMVVSTSYFSLATNMTLKPDWDNGYPSGGNYWSDLGKRYPNASEIANSGIADTTYVIGTPAAINSSRIDAFIVEAIDKYPLLSPVNISEPIIPVSSPPPSPPLEPQIKSFSAAVAIAFTISTVVVGVSLLFYYKKRK